MLEKSIQNLTIKCLIINNKSQLDTCMFIKIEPFKKKIQIYREIKEKVEIYTIDTTICMVNSLDMYPVKREKRGTCQYFIVISISRSSAWDEYNTVTQIIIHWKM